jgi:hypothetical protein
MLSCSKLEHDDMASETRTDQQAPDRRQPPNDPRSAKERPSPGVPMPLVSDGLEAIRDSHC